MRKLFLIFPLLSLALTIGNLFSWRLFESLLWLFATVLIALIFLPLAFKANEKDVPVYQVFAPILLIPIFFSIFAIMDFRQIEVLTDPQAIIYGVVTGVLTLVALMLLIGPSKY
jgi:hypothetical protein